MMASLLDPISFTDMTLLPILILILPDDGDIMAVTVSGTRAMRASWIHLRTGLGNMAWAVARAVVGRCNGGGGICTATA